MQIIFKEIILCRTFRRRERNLTPTLTRTQTMLRNTLLAEMSLNIQMCSGESWTEKNKRNWTYTGRDLLTVYSKRLLNAGWREEVAKVYK